MEINRQQPLSVKGAAEDSLAICSLTSPTPLSCLHLLVAGINRPAQPNPTSTSKDHWQYFIYLPQRILEQKYRNKMSASHIRSTFRVNMKNNSVTLFLLEHIMNLFCGAFIWVSSVAIKSVTVCQSKFIFNLFLFPWHRHFLMGSPWVRSPWEQSIIFHPPAFLPHSKCYWMAAVIRRPAHRLIFTSSLFTLCVYLR